MADGLVLLLDAVPYLLLGVFLATGVAVIPGLGGSFALAVLLPFLLRLDPVAGIVTMMAMAAVSGTGNTITSVLFGIPGSASGVVSTFDGFPMTQRGEGVRAVAAGLSASMVGGLIGALVLGVSLPVLRPLVLALRPPELFALIVLSLVFMSFVAGADRLKALLSALLGVMLSFIGMEASTASQRWTFGDLRLWDGLQLVPVLLGVYAVAEMVFLMRRGGAIAHRPQQQRPLRQLLAGVRDTAHHWFAVLQSAAAGLWVGIAPGMGDIAAQFIGYSQVARTSKRGHLFGTGEVEGVIAADAATNSKEGGALIPTLAFGIPGSSGMAIILAGLLAFGVQPGPAMLVEYVDLVWLIIWVLALANILGALLCMGITPLLAKVTNLRGSLIVAPILVLSLLGSYSVRGAYLDVVTMLAFGVVGVLLKEFGYSRPLFLVGFVLGPLLERNYLLASRLFGPSFLLRPVVVVLLVIAVAAICWPPVAARVRRMLRARQVTARRRSGHVPR